MASRPRSSLLFCGACTRDTIFLVSQLPCDPHGGKRMALDAREVAASGMATTAAVAAMRCAGGETCVAMCGSVGDDVAGRGYLADLASEGVDTTHVRVVAGQSTAISTVLVERGTGERLVVPYYPPGLSNVDDHWPPSADVVGQFDAVQVDTRSPSAALRILAAARGRGVVSVVDADVTPDTAMLRAIVGASDHVVFSRPGMLSLLPPPAPPLGPSDGESWLCAWAVMLRHLWGQFPLAAVIGVTLGADGFVWLETNSDEVYHVVAPTVDVVDTLSAGDVFHGVYTLGVARGNSVREAASMACVAAALKCRTFGGRHGCPKAAEVHDFMKAHGTLGVTRCGDCAAGSGCVHCDASRKV